MEDKLIFIIKFGELEHLKLLREGKLYCKNLKYYNDMEIKTGDREMGDYLDGKLKINDITTCKMYDYETKEIKDLDCKDIVATFEDIDKMPVFCLTGVTLKELDSIETNENNVIKGKINLGNKLGKMGSNDYWENGLLITNGTEFVNRIKNACELNGISMRADEVQYSDMNINYTDRIQSITENVENVAFWKDNYYSYQHEWRFIFQNKRVIDDFTLDIGDISDITKICNKEEIQELFEKDLIIEIVKR
ncbi:MULTISPECIES: hypothetical protein [Clostridium]|uniref:hypothetical protein n=1 Tax=Clostridium TaxID=1485 RepID=UPI0032EF6B6C